MGIIVYDNSRKRLCICRELIVLCDSLRRDFMYKSTPVNTLLFEILGSERLSHLGFIKSVNVTDGVPVTSPLSDVANKELSGFLHSLGRSDTATQLDLIDSFRDYVIKEEERLKTSHTKNSRLYITFGVFSGVLIAIVFV